MAIAQCLSDNWLYPFILKSVSMAFPYKHNCVFSFSDISYNLFFLKLFLCRYITFSNISVVIFQAIMYLWLIFQNYFLSKKTKSYHWITIQFRNVSPLCWWQYAVKYVKNLGVVAISTTRKAQWGESQFFIQHWLFSAEKGKKTSTYLAEFHYARYSGATFQLCHWFLSFHLVNICNL